MAEEFTAKFKVDISDLKKNISEANKQIKLANATFKAETAGMGQWSKDADGLSKKLSQLKTVLQNQKTVLSSYQSQLEKQQAAYNENGKRAEQLKAKLQELASQGVKKTDEEYKKYQAALKSVLKEQENNGKACDDLKLSILEQQAAVNRTEADIKKYSSALSTLEAEEKAAAEAAKRQKTAYESVQDAIANQESKLEALKKEYANVVIEQGKNSDAAKKLASEIDNLSGELADNKKQLSEADKAADELDKSLEDVGDSAEKTSGGFTVMKGALASLVADGIRKAVSAMKDFVASSIEVGKNFDSSMSQVAAVSGATGDELQALRDKAKEMGANTKFSASEAADAFNYMAMAGWKTEDMLSGIDGLLALAAAGNTDLAKTSDIVTDALTAFGASAEDAGRLADIMAAASSNANTNVEMMGETFKYVAPVAGAMGYSMEDASIAIGLMANAGIKGSQAGTSLRSMLTRLAAPPKEAADAMAALGIEITNTDGTMKPLSEVIEILRQKFDGLSEAEQTQYAKSLAGQEAMSGLLAIVNASPADFDKLTDAVNNSNGAAEKMAETMQDNLGGDLTKLGSQFEGVQIALYEKFEPALRAGVDALSGLLDKLSWIIDHGETITAIIIGLGTAVGTFLAIVNRQAIMTAFLGLLGKIKTAFMALNATMAANPIGLVVAAIAGLIAAFVYLWNTSEDFRNFWIGLWEKIKEIAGAAWEAISGFFSQAWEKVKEVWGSVSEWFAEKFKPIIDDLRPVIEAIIFWFQGAWDKIQEIWGKVSDFFKKTFGSISKDASPVVKNIVEWFKGAWEKVKEVWGVVSEWFGEIFNHIKETVGPILDSVAEAFVNAWELIKVVWDLVKPYFENIWNNIKSIFEAVAPVFKAYFELAWAAIKVIWQNVVPYFKAIWNTIKQVFSVVKTFFGGMFKSAWEAIKLVWDVVTGYFKAVWDSIAKIFSVVKDVLTGNWKDAWEGIKSIVSTWKSYFSNVWNGIKNVFSSVKTWFSNTFSSAWTAIKNVFNGWSKFFSGLWDSIKSTFKGLGTSLADSIGGAVKSGLNGVISWIEKTINKAIRLINGALKVASKLTGGWIGTLSEVSLPRLAQGGVLKRGQVGLLEGSGAEAVVPLERNKQWIRAVANDLLNELTSVGAIGRGANSISNNREVNFTQIINAPKQPSRIELYRQTRNLLDFANLQGGV